MYKFNTLYNGRRENANLYKKYRWHIIQLFMWVVHGNVESIQPNSKKASKYATKVIKELSSSDKKYTAAFKKCFEIIDSLDYSPTNDQIKRPRFTSELRKHAEAYLSK